MAARRHRSQRGYTAVELMMSIAVMLVGVGGIMSLQKVTVSSSRHALNLSVATRIAQTWLDHLAAESALWQGSDTNEFNNAPYLTNAAVAPATQTPAGWFQPAVTASLGLGPGYDARGMLTTTAVQQKFCVNLRLRRMYESAVSGVIRAEVRVFWLRQETPAGMTAFGALCNTTNSATVDSQTAAPTLLHIAHYSTAIRQQAERR